MKLTLRFLLTIGLAATCVWAQKSGGTSGGTSGGPSPGGTGTSGSTGTSPGTGTAAPGNVPTVGAPSQTSTPAPPPPQPIFLAGTVVMDDGSPISIDTTIQSVCGTTQRTMAHVAANGEFNFRWTFTMGATFEDASENGLTASSLTSGAMNTGPASSRTGGNPPNGALPDDPLANCELRAVLPGYSSSRIALYNHATDRLNFDVGTITLHRITGNEGRVVSALSLKAPKDAKKNFDKGQEQARAHKTAEAAASFQKAVTAYPQYADAWLELGRAQLELGAKDDARGDFQKAMGLDDKLLGAWQQLGYLASDQSDWPAASRYLDQAVRLDPVDSAMAWYFDAMANYNQGKFDVAERSIRAEMKLDTGANPRAEFLLGIVLISRKDVAGGATVLRKFVDRYPEAAEVGSAKKLLASAERVLAAVPQQ